MKIPVQELSQGGLGLVNCQPGGTRLCAEGPPGGDGGDWAGPERLRTVEQVPMATSCVPATCVLCRYTGR